MMIKTSADPARTAEVVLGHDLWDTPKQIMRACFRPGARVAVKACHASSKTHTAADAVLVALLLGGDVITTAPTWEQVETVLWGQIRRAVFDGASRGWGQVNVTEITMPTGEKAVGLSTNEGVRFQGHHARPDSFLLVIVDEATGVRPDIFEAIEGISAGGDVRILLLGNPTEPSGYFFDVFDKGSPIWTRYTIDAFDTPNLLGLTLDDLLGLPEHELDRNERAYLVTRRWVRDRFYEWGIEHPSWQARVRGEFPTNADTALIWRLWLTQAAEREYEAKIGTGMTAGIDVAGPGEDLTTCCLLRGPDVIDMHGWADADAREPVIAHLKGQVHSGLKVVNVDSIGLGWYFYCDLKDALKPLGVTVNPVNVALPSTTLNDAGKKQFLNLKAEYYWHLRELFRDGQITGLTHEETRRQLGSLRYETKNGLVVAESKEDMRKRGLDSPDYAEAVMLASANVQALPDNLYGAATEMKVSMR